MTWGFVAAGVGTAIGGYFSSQGAKSAASAAAGGAGAAAAEQGREFDVTQQNLAPYLNVGKQAINTLGSIYGYTPYNQNMQGGPNGGPLLLNNVGGVPTVNADLYASDPIYKQAWDQTLAKHQAQFGTGYTDRSNQNQLYSDLTQTIASLGGLKTATPSASPAAAAASSTGAPDYSSFFASPDYQFRKDQGMQGISNSFSASGGAKSGNALKALADFNSNLAAGEFGNYFNRQAALAGIGQTATNTGASAGATAAGQIGNSLIQAGDARASGIAGSANAWGNALGGIGQGLGYYLYNRTPTLDSGWGTGANANGALADAGYSDARLKEGIERIGTLKSGIPVYRYRFIDSAREHIGVLAHEVLKVIPDAVSVDESGYLKVNYRLLH